MRVLLDHNVPRQLRRVLQAHHVSTARTMEWDELSNGDLLSAAQARGFHIFVTADKNLAYQQNLQGRTLALVVLSTNSWKKIRRDLLPIIDAVDSATPCSFQAVSLTPTPKR